MCIRDSFTSPIRRYADLLVHRLLDRYLQSKAIPKHQEQDLTEIGKHITFTEQRAEDAERELTTVLILIMLSKRIGEKLDCVVTGLAGFGVFVQSRKLGIEGLIQMADLGPDTWKYNSRTQSILGLRSGHSIHLGQAIEVRILSVNVPGRQLSLAPVEPLIDAPVQGKKKKATKKSQKGRARKRSRRKK